MDQAETDNSQSADDLKENNSQTTPLEINLLAPEDQVEDKQEALDNSFISNNLIIDESETDKLTDHKPIDQVNNNKYTKDKPTDQSVVLDNQISIEQPNKIAQGEEITDSEEQISKFVLEMKTRPELYERQRGKEFLERELLQKVDKQWLEVAVVMGWSVAECRRKWRNLRYALKRRVSEEWKWGNKLDFLIPIKIENATVDKQEPQSKRIKTEDSETEDESTNTELYIDKIIKNISNKNKTIGAVQTNDDSAVQLETIKTKDNLNIVTESNFNKCSVVNLNGTSIVVDKNKALDESITVNKENVETNNIYSETRNRTAKLKDLESTDDCHIVIDVLSNSNTGESEINVTKSNNNVTNDLKSDVKENPNLELLELSDSDSSAAVCISDVTAGNESNVDLDKNSSNTLKMDSDVNRKIRYDFKGVFDSGLKNSTNVNATSVISNTSTNKNESAIGVNDNSVSENKSDCTDVLKKLVNKDDKNMTDVGSIFDLANEKKSNNIYDTVFVKEEELVEITGVLYKGKKVKTNLPETESVIQICDDNSNDSQQANTKTGSIKKSRKIVTNKVKNNSNKTNVNIVAELLSEDDSLSRDNFRAFKQSLQNDKTVIPVAAFQEQDDVICLSDDDFSYSKASSSTAKNCGPAANIDAEQFKTAYMSTPHIPSGVDLVLPNGVRSIDANLTSFVQYFNSLEPDYKKLDAKRKIEFLKITFSSLDQLINEKD